MKINSCVRSKIKSQINTLSDISFIVQWLCTFPSSSFTHSSDIKRLYTQLLMRFFFLLPVDLTSLRGVKTRGVKQVCDFYCSWEKVWLLFGQSSFFLFRVWWNIKGRFDEIRFDVCYFLKSTSLTFLSHINSRFSLCYLSRVEGLKMGWDQDIIVNLFLLTGCFSSFILCPIIIMWL